MVKAKRKRNLDLINDYVMLNRMSKELSKQQNRVLAIGRSLYNIEKKAQSDMEDGLIENLDFVAFHMKKARNEIEKAKKKLKMI